MSKVENISFKEENSSSSVHSIIPLTNSDGLQAYILKRTVQIRR